MYKLRHPLQIATHSCYEVKSSTLLAVVELEETMRLDAKGTNARANARTRYSYITRENGKKMMGGGGTSATAGATR